MVSTNGHVASFCKADRRHATARLEAGVPSDCPIIVWPMNSVLTTDAGTEVYEPSAKEYAEY